ncbi:hypothetical protein SCLCIDRAFT_55996, partial [Scleroderma citrinum Foug A]
RAVLARRMMSSHAGHSAGGDEKYWRVGSMLVFGPALFYLLSPAARNTAHKHTVEHEAEAVTAVASQEQEPPMTDDEGTAVSSEEVKASVERALTEDSPKSAQEDGEGVAAETPSEPSTEPKPESASEGEKDDASEEPNPGPEVEAETEDSKKDAPADAQSEPEKPAV